jgi:hypothetical protein
MLSLLKRWLKAHLRWIECILYPMPYGDINTALHVCRRIAFSAKEDGRFKFAGSPGLFCKTLICAAPQIFHFTTCCSPE